MKQARTTTTQGKEEEEDGCGRIQKIPEECLVKAVCLTSPADACRAAAVSTAFRSAADSDEVWESFLPPDCDAILERAVHLVDSSSKKELFLDLAQEHILLDDGKISFGLQRRTGAKCYMLSATQLEIAWITIDLYWGTRSDPDSRFSKVAELMSVCWFSIYGVIDRRELTPRTHYAGYLVFKLSHDASGLSSPRQVSFVEVGGQRVGPLRTASFHPCDRPSCTMMTAGEGPHEHEEEEEGGGVLVVTRYPRQRAEDDGWLELEMGDFHTGASDDDDAAQVRVEVHELEELQWKKGLIVEGIEIRPKN